MRDLLSRVIHSALRRTFPVWQAVGVHVTPVHFYQPIPDTRVLDDALWQPRMEAAGIDFRADHQVELLKTFEREYRSEYERFPRRLRPGERGYFLDNPLFTGLDGQVLYCMVRHFRPRRVIEVGSGMSTLVFARGIAQNKVDDSTYDCDFTTIDPYPPPLLADGIPELTRRVRAPVQSVPLAEFDALADNDVLFIDSSHVVTVGSDVQHLMLCVLPRLRPGVLVHFHDIFLPDEYPREWVHDRRWFWTEQYLLQAFLAFNRDFEVLWAANLLHRLQPAKLEHAFTGYRRDGRLDGRLYLQGSFWIRRVSSSDTGEAVLPHINTSR